MGAVQPLRGCPRSPLRTWLRCGAQGGWVAPPTKCAEPPTALVEVGQCTPRGPCLGDRVARGVGGIGSADPTPGPFGPGGSGGDHPPAEGTLWGVWGVPPQPQGGADRHTPLGPGGHPPDPPVGYPPGTPPRDTPRDTPGPPGCTFFWVFNNSPSRDKDGTLFWDGILGQIPRWDKTPHRGPLRGGTLWRKRGVHWGYGSPWGVVWGVPWGYGGGYGGGYPGVWGVPGPP